MKTNVMVAMIGILGMAGSARTADYYVAPDGRREAPGSLEQPWDIVSALDGSQAVKAGDTLWIRGGSYRSTRAYTRQGDNWGQGFAIRISGSADNPVHVRALPGERASLDGGAVVEADHLWLRDLEITVTPDEEVTRVAPDGKLGAPAGGLTINRGVGCKFINLVVQDNFVSGVNWWRVAEGELYGCIIVNNGYTGAQRNHGHCIYTQNDGGTKRISNTIMSTRFSGGQFTMHAYGSANADVNNYVIEENIAYDNGGRFLIGGGRPSRGIVARRNFLHNTNLQVGYNAPHNEDCEVRDNVVFGNSISVTRYRKATVTGNLVIGGGVNVANSQEVVQENNAVSNQRPELPLAVLLPNAYEPARANLVIFNFPNAASVTVEVAGFLENGQSCRLLDPERFFDEPVHRLTARDGRITVPMDAEFAVFVMLADPLAR